MNQPRKKLKSRISLKSLSPARQELIVCMHEMQFGTINQLPVLAGEPNLKLAKIVRRRSLNRNAVARPTSKNFIHFILFGLHHFLDKKRIWTTQFVRSHFPTLAPDPIYWRV